MVWPCGHPMLIRQKKKKNAYQTKKKKKKRAIEAKFQRITYKFSNKIEGIRKVPIPLLTMLSEI